MGQPITFNTIDIASRVPRHAMEFDTTSGVRNLPVNAKKLLLVGQSLAGASVAVSTPTPIFRASDGAQFGAGSILDTAVRAALLANPNVDLTAVAMADAGGSTAATETLTFTGTATGVGGVECDVCGQTVKSSIATGDTPTVQALAFKAAHDAMSPALPTTCTLAAGVATLTSKSKGQVANGIHLAARVTGAPGITAVLSNGTGNLTGGTGTADPTAALASAAGVRYHDVVVLIDDTTGITAARDSVNAQGAAEVGFGEVAIAALNGALSTATTMANALNGERVLLGAIKDSPSWNVEIAAALGAVIQSETVPNRPYNFLVLTGIKPPPVASRWIRSEQKSMLANGVTPLVVIPGEQVAILRAESTRTKNAQAVTDMTESDITIIQSFDYVRDACSLMFSTNYGRSRWADEDPDGLLPADVATPGKVKSSLIDTMRALEGLGIVENVDNLLDAFHVNKVGTNCQYEVPTDLIVGLQEIYGKAVLTGTF
jgi:phage tail sheath gpL-like